MGFSLGSAAEGVGSIAQGVMGMQSDDAQAGWSDFNAKNAQIAGEQAEANRVADLISTQSSVDAVRSARGLQVDSPTGMALSQNLSTQANRSIQQSNLNYMSQQASDDAQAQADRSKGDAALLGGFLQGGQQGYDAYKFDDWSL
jgi:hypothetical protein